MAAIWGGKAINWFGAWTMSVIADFLSFASVPALPLIFLYVDGVSPAFSVLLVLLGALFDPTVIAARQTLVPGVAIVATVATLSGFPADLNFIQTSNLSVKP
ncbi:MAG: hypothetical protein HC769_11385 [Cyanobacteria bacterium CRU_2_1]|nr:hypothetical protein [Cyanobacteria bacterium RU_5_0]NJR59392.1 hypothetical protein [Cyanobacteria bacterium CRU_2_1]